MDMDASSVGGMSDTNSLVGFGEGARTPARYSGYGSPNAGKATPTTSSSLFNPAGRDPSLTPVSTHTISEQRDARPIDGVSYDQQSLDTPQPHRTPEPLYPMGGSSSGTEEAERIIQERLGSSGDGKIHKTMESREGVNSQGGRDLGKFYFEGR